MGSVFLKFSTNTGVTIKGHILHGLSIDQKSNYYDTC